jgi:hypothetical protein
MERFWPKSKIVNYLLSFSSVKKRAFCPRLLDDILGPRAVGKDGYFLTKVIRSPKIPIGGAYTGKTVSAPKTSRKLWKIDDKIAWTLKTAPLL